MKKVKLVTKGEYYTAINIGALENIGKYSLMYLNMYLKLNVIRNV